MRLCGESGSDRAQGGLRVGHDGLAMADTGHTRVDAGEPRLRRRGSPTGGEERAASLRPATVGDRDAGPRWVHRMARLPGAAHRPVRDPPAPQRSRRRAAPPGRAALGRRPPSGWARSTASTPRGAVWYGSRSSSPRPSFRGPSSGIGVIRARRSKTAAIPPCSGLLPAADPHHWIPETDRLPDGASEPLEPGG